MLQPEDHLIISVSVFVNALTIMIWLLFISVSYTLLMQKKGNVCLGILDGSSVHDGSTIILGGKINIHNYMNLNLAIIEH